MAKLLLRGEKNMYEATKAERKWVDLGKGTKTRVMPGRKARERATWKEVMGRDRSCQDSWALCVNLDIV